MYHIVHKNRHYLLLWLLFVVCRSILEPPIVQQIYTYSYIHKFCWGVISLFLYIYVLNRDLIENMIPRSLFVIIYYISPVPFILQPWYSEILLKKQMENTFKYGPRRGHVFFENLNKEHFLLCVGMKSRFLYTRGWN